MTGSGAVVDAAPVAKNPLKTKTFWFAFLGAAAHVAVDYKNPSAWLESASIVGAAYSARQAISKNGLGL